MDNVHSGFARSTQDDDSFRTSITTPVFRVRIGPQATPLTSSVPSPSGSVVPVERHLGVSSARENHPAYPPNSLANSYLSTMPTASGSAQSIIMPKGSTVPVQGPGADEKRHRCPHCNKRFNRPSSLNIHVNTHTGAKRTCYILLL